MVSAAAIYIGIMTVITFAVYSSLGHVFFASISYLALSGSSSYTLPSFPTLQYLAGLATNNPILEILLGIGLLTSLLAIIGTILPFVQIRMLFAWSFDCVIPKKFADVNEKYHVPHYAILAIIIVNVIFDYLAIYTPFASYFTYNVTASLFIAGIVGLAALVFPRRKKDLFAASPSLVNKMVGGIPLISILGAIQLVLGVSIAYASLLPAIAGPLNPFYISFVVALFVICFVFYWLAFVVQKKRGIPLDLIMKQIPPE
jgi:amino acid transporter